MTTQRKPPYGAYFSIDGPDGVGKSVMVEELAARLRDRGYVVTTVREPGGTPEAELVRKLILSPDHDFSDTEIALLYFTARFNLLRQVIIPALNNHHIVISDRSHLSTQVMQVKMGTFPSSPYTSLTNEWVNQLSETNAVLSHVVVTPTDKNIDQFMRNRKTDADRFDNKPEGYYRELVKAFRLVVPAYHVTAHAGISGPVHQTDVDWQEDGGYDDALVDHLEELLKITIGHPRSFLQRVKDWWTA